MGECEGNSVLGDKRMAELAILGEIHEDLLLDEVHSYNGTFPLWKRIMVAFRTIRVRLFMCCTVIIPSPIDRETGYCY